MKNSIFVLTILLSFSAFGQTPGRQARVLEVEKMLQGEIQTTIRDLIPGQSFHVNVTIDAIHRNRQNSLVKETMPYFETADEITDEWDDPNKSDYELLKRVNRISIKAGLPLILSKEQMAEIKMAILHRMPFVEGRDLIELEQREWLMKPEKNQNLLWLTGIALISILVLGAAYLKISSRSVSRVSKAIENLKMPSVDSSADIGPKGMTEARAFPDMASSGGQLKLNDTIRMTEAIAALVGRVESSGEFPNLEDMSLFERYLKTQPRSVGALLGIFPPAMKDKIFSYSASEFWLKGLGDPGDVDAISFELMNKIVRNSRDSRLANWHELLVLCWRLGAELPNFLRKIDRTEALTILKALPQSISVPTARELMPGEWGVLMKRGVPVEPLAEEKIVKYRETCLELLPLRSLRALEQYKKDADLIEYLKFSEPRFEKEIYGAAPPESELNSLRPPFFPILDRATDEIRDFAMTISLEDWSCALLNIAKNDRSRLDAAFTDKQRFRLSELLKRNDRQGVDSESIGDARERIARSYAKVFQNSPRFLQSATGEAA